MTLRAPTLDVECFHAEGYLVVRNVLDEHELIACRAEVDRLEGVFERYPEDDAVRVLWHAPADGGPRHIKQVEPVVDLSDLFAQLACDPRIAGPAALMLGEDGASLFEDKLMAKPPGGAGLPWHQDWSCCWRAHTDQLVTCFVSLDDANAENGALELIPGSHLERACLPFADESMFTAVVDPTAAKQSVMPPVRAGDMIVFSPYLLHSSGRNVSTGWRRTMVYTYGPASLGEMYHYDVSSGEIRWVDDIYEYEADSPLKWVLRKPIT
jgi:ectoine hydroxylase-related dioxygenase (phytanoyl-CoA dioxygenase family)